MDRVNKVMFTSLITNVFLTIIKIIFGIILKSGALVSDGLHSFSDMITDIFAGFGNIVSKKPADFEHPYGHGSAEYITCLIIGLIVGFMGFNVIKAAFTTKSVIPSFYASIVSLITIFMKLILSKYMLNKGKVYDSNILISSGKESFSDVISSLVVFISVILSRMSKYNKLLLYSDKIAMTIVGILIIKIAYEIIRENLSNLLGRRVDNEYLKHIEKIILDYDDIKTIDKLIAINFGYFKKIDCEVSMDPNMKLKKVHEIIDLIENKIKKDDETVSNIIIHVNPYKGDGQYD